MFLLLFPGFIDILGLGIRFDFNFVLVDLLISNGAKTNVNDANGYSPLDIAKSAKKNSKEIVSILESVIMD